MSYLRLAVGRLSFATTSLLLLAMAVSPAAAVPDLQSGFPVAISSAPADAPAGPAAVGDVNGDGVADIVIGDGAGRIHAYTGLGQQLWVFDTGAMGIAGKPAIGDIDGDGLPEVVVGAGSTFTPNADGGLYVISHLGGLQCAFQTTDDGDADPWREGVYSSPALADLDGNDNGRLEIAFGAWDRFIRVIHHDCNPLWEKSVFDTVWSSPAIADLDGDGDLDVVIGQDTGADVGFEDGGLMRAFNGADGVELPGFPIQVDEVIWSSPALGDVDGDGSLDIVVGTGRCWADDACAPGGNGNPGVGEYLSAWDKQGNPLPGWPIAIPGAYAFASPALADLDGDGALEVILNTIDTSGLNGSQGKVYALNASGSSVPGWPVQPRTPADCAGNFVSFSTSYSPIVADVDGDGGLEVVLPSNWELVVWDDDGQQLTRDSCSPALVLTSNGPINGAAVADLDGDGDLEVVASSTDGSLYAWDFTTTVAPPATPWPQFRRSADSKAAVFDADEVFTDGFESGDISRWSSATTSLAIAP